MAKPSAKHAWTIKGLKYDKEGPVQGNIDINEDDPEMSMGTSTASYGKPIDGTLAIHLMGDLLKKLNEDLDLNIADSLFPKNHENLTVTKSWLIELLKVSFGITFDKHIILKILSQPKCEGMRYYLCLKNQKNPDTGNMQDFLSLVLVGVDAQGKDLLYTGTKLGDDGSIMTQSLTAEYGHPPPPPPPPDPPLLQDERYVLLRLAEQLLKK